MAMKNFLQQASRRRDCLYAIFPYQSQAVVPSPLIKGSAVYPISGSADNGSWAERNGLVTLNNMIVENNGITPLDNTAISAINTPLDMQNNETSKTFIAKIKFNRIISQNVKVNPVFSQGFHMNSSSLYVFSFTLRQSKNLLYFNIAFSFISKKIKSYTYILEDSFCDYWHTLALTYDVADDGLTASSALYIDGAHCTESSFDHYQWNDLGKYSYMKMGICEEVNTQYLAGSSLAWALVFDSALTPEEIALFK